MFAFVPRNVLGRWIAAGFLLALTPILSSTAFAQAKQGSATPTPQPSATPDTRFKPAKLLTHPAPAYPELALLNRMEGVVRARFSIDEQGHVLKVNAVRSGGTVMLDSVVGDPTLQKWTFQPATLDGKPVTSSLDQEIEFHLDPEQQRKFAAQRLALKEGFPEPAYPPEFIPLRVQGTCKIGVTWTAAGLVDFIYLDESSGSNILDRAALHWVFLNWRIDPKNIVYAKDAKGKDLPFVRAVTYKLPGTP